LWIFHLILKLYQWFQAINYFIYLRYLCSSITHVERSGFRRNPVRSESPSPVNGIPTGSRQNYLNPTMPNWCHIFRNLEMQYLLEEICPHLRISGYVTLLRLVRIVLVQNNHRGSGNFWWLFCVCWGWKYIYDVWFLFI
jgi:hypothetical protein